MKAEWPHDNLLLPINEVTSEQRTLFVDYFGKHRFRRIAWKIIQAHGNPVSLLELDGIANKRATEYVDFLASLGIVRRDATHVHLIRNIRMAGATWEWYIAQLCRLELRGSVAWSVSLEGMMYNDYDVIAWLDPALMYVETKAGSAANIGPLPLRQFLQRTQEFAPDLGILLVDTESEEELSRVVKRLNRIICGTYRKLNNNPILDTSWATLSPPPEFPGIYYVLTGRRIYVTHARPSILHQLPLCLRHYYRRAQHQSMFDGEMPVDFITPYGEWETTT